MLGAGHGWQAGWLEVGCRRHAGARLPIQPPVQLRQQTVEGLEETGGFHLDGFCDVDICEESKDADQIVF